jgi:hypothetical protein
MMVRMKAAGRLAPGKTAGAIWKANRLAEKNEMVTKLKINAS